ncbi:hypothetical protein C8J57DRAFT_1524865 [Mycena rebaudengoi]|nr:hypothetical protein C8J57DRAFT_1524865 [Mycena rebaudengoi]
MAELSNTEFLNAIIYPRSTIALVAKFMFDVLQGLRPNFNQLDSDDLLEELEAQSTIGATSSPPGPHLPDYNLADNIPFGNLNSDDFIDDDNDDTYNPVSGRAPKTTSTEKALIVLAFMRERFPRCSLRTFLETLFTSDNGSIKNFTNMFFQIGGALELMKIVVGDIFRMMKLGTGSSKRLPISVHGRVVG